MVERRGIPASQVNIPPVFRDRFSDLESKKSFLLYLCDIIQKKSPHSETISYLDNITLSNMINEEYGIDCKANDVQRLLSQNVSFFENAGVDLKERKRRQLQKVNQGKIPPGPGPLMRVAHGVDTISVFDPNRKVPVSKKPSTQRPKSNYRRGPKINH